MRLFHGNVVVIPDSLKHEERRRLISSICYEVRTAWGHGIYIAGAQLDFFGGLAERKPHTPIVLTALASESFVFEAYR